MWAFTGIKNSDFLKGDTKELIKRQSTERLHHLSMLSRNILPSSIDVSLTVLCFTGFNPSRPDAKQQEETVGHHQVAGSGERHALLRLPRPVAMLFGFQLSLLADWALHAAGEGGRAKGLINCHILLNLHGLSRGHE